MSGSSSSQIDPDGSYGFYDGDVFRLDGTWPGERWGGAGWQRVTPSEEEFLHVREVTAAEAERILFLQGMGRQVAYNDIDEWRRTRFFRCGGMLYKARDGTTLSEVWTGALWEQASPTDDELARMRLISDAEAARLIESTPIDAHAFLDDSVKARYEDGEPLGLGDVGTLDPADDSMASGENSPPPSEAEDSP